MNDNQFEKLMNKLKEIRTDINVEPKRDSNELITIIIENFYSALDAKVGEKGWDFWRINEIKFIFEYAIFPIDKKVLNRIDK